MWGVTKSVGPGDIMYCSGGLLHGILNVSVQRFEEAHLFIADWTLLD
jgi:hypothetical protein